MKGRLLTGLALLLGSAVFAQDTTTIDFYPQIRGKNLTQIWMTDSVIDESAKGEGSEKVTRVDPIGFVGEDYQRFYIHFKHIVKSKNVPDEYVMSGKTRVGNTIRNFRGTIKVYNARLYNHTDFDGYQEGYVVCNVLFLEDKTDPTAGYLTGRLLTKFLIDEGGNFRYNGTLLVYEGYWNNQFTGSWRHFTDKSNWKRCNFGEYRIPDCGDLDVGTEGFTVNPKYKDKGWQTYGEAETEWWR